MEDIYAVPEYAIRTFEHFTHLSVVVHDQHGLLWPYLAPGRFHHHTHWCTAVKTRGLNERCHDFEVTRLMPEIASFPDGRIQCCHAGFIEWVAPLFEAGEVACILFAGQRMAEDELPELVLDVQSSRGEFPAWSRQPAVVHAEEAAFILESLRQLVARLTQWRTLVKQVRPPANAGATYANVDRMSLVRRFIHARHTEAATIAELAEEMKLSPGRSAHLVRELFGQTFHELLTEARVRTAASLLRHTPYAIDCVAYTSGFSDLSHFYRVFKRDMHMTPYRYRMQSRHDIPD